MKALLPLLAATSAVLLAPVLNRGTHEITTRCSYSTTRS
jgi:hypothetical protein